MLDGPLRESTQALRRRGRRREVARREVPAAPRSTASSARSAPASARRCSASTRAFRSTRGTSGCPGPPGGPWAGIVRCEASAALRAEQVDRARRPGRRDAAPLRVRAAQGSARAPQNLYPIGGLERELRHRLGDPNVVYRALRRASAA